MSKSNTRCAIYRVKLTLAQQTVGSCKCGLVFCASHRLPEQHECAFDRDLTVKLPEKIEAAKVTKI